MRENFLYESPDAFFLQLVSTKLVNNNNNNNNTKLYFHGLKTLQHISIAHANYDD